MDLRRRLQRRTLISAALIFTALLGCLAWWTLHDTRREIDATGSLVRATVATVLRTQTDVTGSELAAPSPALRHVTIELTTLGQGAQAIQERHWVDRIVGLQPEEIALPGNTPATAGKVLLVRPNARSELIEHLLFSATAFGAILLLGIVIAMTQYRTLISAFAPVQSLKTQIETFERGDLSARLPVPELDELAVIARSFNRLADNLQQTLNEQSRLSQLLISTRIEERHRLARELHDDLGQLLTAISVNVASLKRNLDDPIRTQATITSLERDLQGLRAATRKMLADLREAPNQDLWQQREPVHIINDWRQRFGAVDWQLPADLSERLGRLRLPEYEVAARILQESLTNIFRHSCPTMICIDLTLESDAPSARAEKMIIENDGFSTLENRDVGGSTQLGITGMSERAAQVGAKFSSALSSGATVSPRWRVELQFARS